VGVAVVLITFALLGMIAASVATDRALLALPDEDALQIEVTAHQWWWEFRYADPDPSRRFVTANELHVPVGRPVTLTLEASDVIHSFWVPRLAGKRDLIPGHTTTLRFQADRPGVYRGQCAEFCGHQHAHMALLVVAEPPARYAAWAERQRQPAPPAANPTVQRGREIFEQRTCAMCHAISGTPAAATRGPDLTHVGGRRTLAAATIPNTRENLVRWIADPHHDKPGVNMPPHAYRRDELEALAAYLGSLR
jgi:cytochrome c oxidase subunit 2